MSDEKIMRDAALMAHEMQKMISKKTKNDDSVYIFKFGTFCLGSLLAGFIDAIIKNENHERKLALSNEILHLTKMLLVNKEKEREANSNGKH